MFGPKILARSLSQAVPTGATGEPWQYHPRGDRHSKIACWGALFDVLRSCTKLREHIAAGRVGFSIDHEAQDHTNGRTKNIDLIICRPSEAESKKNSFSFSSLVERYSIILSATERAALSELPPLLEMKAGEVQIALKAKACMTGHTGAIRRLFDELDSWQTMVSRMAPTALRAGIVIVNSATEYYSPTGRDVIRHSQPRAASLVVSAMSRIPRCIDEGKDGFDSLGVILIDCKNDQSTKVRWDEKEPAPRCNEQGNYNLMIRHLSSLYEDHFQYPGRQLC